MAVYKAFLTSERPFEDEHGSVSLANSTFPLDISEELANNNGCLKGIDFENLAAAEKTVYLLGAEIIQGQNLTLINRKSIHRQIFKGEEMSLLGII